MINVMISLKRWYFLLMRTEFKMKVLLQNTGYVNYLGNSEYKMRCLNYMFMLNVSTWMLCINKSTCFLPVLYT